MYAAIDAIIGDDRAALARCLVAEPGLVKQGLKDERFIEAIVHQVYVGDTLLHIAAAGFRFEMAAHLLTAGANVAARNRRGAHPLHYAADANLFAPESQAHTLHVLLSRADPNAVDKSGTAPLHRAVRTRGAAAVEALLEGGADPNLKNGSGSTPLFLAHHTTGKGGSGSGHAKAEQAEIIRLLLAVGARET